MNNILHLCAHGFSQQPVCWKNFYTTYYNRNDSWRTFDDISSKLSMLYCAKLVCAASGVANTFVEFPDEDTYIQFLLEWS